MNSPVPSSSASKAPMPTGQTGSPLPVTGSAATAKTEGFSVLQGSLPRLLGYGLLALFALDVLQVIVGYRWFNPEADLNFAAQFIERMGVPIVGYALIFGVNNTASNRHERSLLKLLSWGAMVGMILYLALSVLVVTASVRLYGRAMAMITYQESLRVGGFEAGRQKLETMPVGQLALIYRQILPTAKIEGNEERAQLIAGIQREMPNTLKTVREGAETARAALYKGVVVTGAKYFLGGIICVVICLVTWENTRVARRHRIFRTKDAPTMQFEDRAADTLRKVQRSAEDAFALHVLERYRWYRKLRRFFTGKH